MRAALSPIIAVSSKKFSTAGNSTVLLTWPEVGVGQCGGARECRRVIAEPRLEGEVDVRRGKVGESGAGRTGKHNDPEV